jgi:hypothetical protein
LNEQVIIIIGRLHPTCRGVMKRKYTQLVLQYGPALNVPLEFHFQMLSVNHSQWFTGERLNSPSVKGTVSPLDRIFELQYEAPSFKHLSLKHDHSSLQLDSMYIPMTTVDRTIEHIVCYVYHKAIIEPYPKCENCAPPIHYINQCHPLTNFCLDQALCIQHPDIV